MNTNSELGTIHVVCPLIPTSNLPNRDYFHFAENKKPCSFYPCVTASQRDNYLCTRAVLGIRSKCKVLSIGTSTCHITETQEISIVQVQLSLE